MDFRFAIMGAANIANKFCDAVSRLDGVNICAVASKSLERAKAFADKNKIPSAYDDYAEMLKTEQPDAVYIAVTQNDHYRLSMLALDYGVPILCEKAMFLNSKDAEAFFFRAEKDGVFAMEAMWSRFLPAINKAKEWIDAGKIGEVVFADFGIGFAAPNDPSNRYFSPELGGGAMYDITVYGYDILTWVLSRKVLSYQSKVVRGGTGVDATEVVLLDMEGNVPALIKSSLVTPMEERLAVFGTEGKIIIPVAHFAASAELYNRSGKLCEHYIDTETANGFVYEIAEAVRCVRERLAESPIVPHSLTMETARLYDSLLEKLSK